MAHKTLINGTAYEISGGKTRVNGTGYSIKNGKTLVGGTAYEVEFAKPVVVTLTTSVYNNIGLYSITIDGQTYDESVGTIEIVVPIGTLVTCSAKATGSATGVICIGTRGGETTIVAEVPKGSSEPATYTYQIVGRTTFTMATEAFKGQYIYITEE